MVDVELDLTKEEEQEIVVLYVSNHLREESKSVFLENMSRGIPEALYKAIFNDSCIDCIEAGIREAKTDDE